ncbi:hypothetical protein ACWOFR_05245 [Carnobacterium gallinarum]|uniref:hypothetical protein n=1 Tax=Carnobacterium gallinarum TaxID=2749 RepID=UPI000558E477|nr:hypothetical protein [Carnobacterium gallinarum]
MNNKIIYFLIKEQDCYIDFWYRYYYQHSFEGMSVKKSAEAEFAFKSETKWLIQQFIQNVYGTRPDGLLEEFYKRRFSKQAQSKLSFSEIETNTLMYERAIRTFLQKSLEAKELDVTYDEIESFNEFLHQYHEELFLGELRNQKTNE